MLKERLATLDVPALVLPGLLSDEACWLVSTLDLPVKVLSHVLLELWQWLEEEGEEWNLELDASRCNLIEASCRGCI
jgi:hypothetical protein